MCSPYWKYAFQTPLGSPSTTPSRKRRKTQPALHVLVQISGPEIDILKSGKMLTDQLVNSASAILKKGFPDIKGLQSTLNARCQRGFKPAEEGSIQILHCGDNFQHWVTTCFMEGQVLLLWQSWTNKSIFDSRAWRTNSSSIWNYSWTERSLRDNDATCTKTNRKDWLRMICHCLGSTSRLWWQAWNHNIEPETASFSSWDMSASATGHNVPTLY